MTNKPGGPGTDAQNGAGTAAATVGQVAVRVTVTGERGAVPADSGRRARATAARAAVALSVAVTDVGGGMTARARGRT